MKPALVILAVVGGALAAFSWTVHRRNRAVLAEAELWAVAGADTDGVTAPTPTTAPRSAPTSAEAGTPPDALPDTP